MPLMSDIIISRSTKKKNFKNIASEALTQCLFLFLAYLDTDVYHRSLLSLHKKETMRKISGLRCSYNFLEVRVAFGRTVSSIPQRHPS